MEESVADRKNETMNVKKDETTSKLNRSEVKKRIAQFILRHKSGEGFRRLSDISEILQKDPNLKDELIREIHEYVVKKYPLADKTNVEIDSQNLERVLSCISVKDFIQKKYESYPFLLKNDDFYKMLSCEKLKVGIKGFKKGESFKFLNNYVKPWTSIDDRLVNSYYDTQFYLSQDRQILFAKTVRQIFRIHDKKRYFETFAHHYGEHDYSLSERGASVGMFAFLQGKEERPCLFARIDDDGYNHQNLIIDERKKTVFGEVAGYPHFHFQNELDQYLCRKESPKGYKTGRSNAIDIPHLIDYLKYLESLPTRTLEKMLKEGDDVDLPFLAIMFERDKFFPEPMKIIEDFVAQQDGIKLELCQRMFTGFDEKYKNSEQLSGLKFFKDFGFGLLLIQYISDLYHSKYSKSLTYKDFLAQFEIYLCEKVMDAVCNVGEKVAYRNDGSPYYVKNDFGKDFVNYVATI